MHHDIYVNRSQQVGLIFDQLYNLEKDLKMTDQQVRSALFLTC